MMRTKIYLLYTIHHENKYTIRLSTILGLGIIRLPGGLFQAHAGRNRGFANRQRDSRETQVPAFMVHTPQRAYSAVYEHTLSLGKRLMSLVASDHKY